jgi:hypothetical protein
VLSWGNECGGGDDGTRTHDPLLAKQVLFQLSYIPGLTCGFASYCAPVRLAQRSTVHNPLLAPSFDRYGWTRFAQFLLQRRALRACRQEILNAIRAYLFWICSARRHGRVGSPCVMLRGGLGCCRPSASIVMGGNVSIRGPAHLSFRRGLPPCGPRSSCGPPWERDARSTQGSPGIRGVQLRQPADSPAGHARPRAGRSPGRGQARRARPRAPLRPGHPLLTRSHHRHLGHWDRQLREIQAGKRAYLDASNQLTYDLRAMTRAGVRAPASSSRRRPIPGRLAGVRRRV